MTDAEPIIILDHASSNSVNVIENTIYDDGKSTWNNITTFTVDVITNIYCIECNYGQWIISE